MLFKPDENGKVGEGVARIAAGARRRTVSLFIGLVILAGLGWLAWSHFYGGNYARRDRCDRPVSINLCETSQLPVVIDDRCGQSCIRAHALLENLFRVIGSLDQRRTLYIAEPILFRRIHVNVVDSLADRTIPAPGNAAQ